MNRREEDLVLRRGSGMEVDEVRLRRRPKETGKPCVEEDVRKMNIREET